MSRNSLITALALLAFALGACSRSSTESDGNVPVRFTYRGPNAVFLAGEFNGWSMTATPMHRQSPGDWVVDLRLKPGRYQYKFVINGEWYQDGGNPDAVPDGWGGNNSVMTVPAPAVAPSPAPTPKAVAGKLSPTNAVRQVRWKSIEYPDVPVPGTPEKTLRFRVSSGGDAGGKGEPEHLRFDIIWNGLDNVPLPSSLSHPAQIRAHLHSGPSFVNEGAALQESDVWDGAGNGHYFTFSRGFIFPWTRNSFDEAWIECRLPSQTYWIEIPYGFTRNPEDPWPEADKQRGYPVFPAVMRGLPGSDRIVPWLHVSYDLGEIQNRWRLSANLANPFDPAVEVVLYHDPDVGQSNWNGDTPRTAVEIKRTGAHDLGSSRAGFYLRGLLERMDVFTLGRDGSPAAGRGIGWMTIHVDESAYTFTIPSSLFKYVHGTADPKNKQRISRGEGLFERMVQSAE